MSYIQAFFAFISAFLKGLPILNKWFTKSTTEKVIERQESTDEEIEKAKKTGRPTWTK